MAKVIGYGVESDMEGGFLAEPSPSVWVCSLESAIRYETPAQAWASAKRRPSAFASAIAITQDEDGTLSWESVPDPAKASGGDWIVWFEPKPGARRMFVMKNGKQIVASSRRSDAKGYKMKSAAEKLASQMTEKGAVAGVEQLTAQVIAIG